MKNFIRFSFIVLLGTMILFSCKLKTDDGDEIVDPVDGAIILTGTVTSDYTGNPVVNALVQVYDDSLLANGTTDSDGEYSIQVEILHDAEFTLVISGNDFISDTTTVFGILNETNAVPEIRLVPSESGTITFTGTVLNDITGNVVSGAIISAFNEYVSEEALSDILGEFTLNMTIYEEGEYEVAVFKEGFRPDTTTAYALFDASVSIPTFRLNPTGQTVEDGTGEAASIYLAFQSDEFLGIKESGTIETASLVFEVQDSSGIPIDINHSVAVELSITAGPGGGEYVYPSTAATNADGKVYFTVNTGTAAGVLQCEAFIDLGTRTIRSMPVFFTIYGGFPVQERFEVASEKLNYPYYGTIGQTIVFTAYMGDQYTNAVRPGTSVYFDVIEGDGYLDDFTPSDELGRATATYLAFGSPDHSIYGDGFFEIQASTVTQTSVVITTSTLRLLSGPSIVYNVAPLTFDIANGGGETFTFTVSDANGNPLSEGSSIGVSAEGGNLKAAFDAVNLPDVMFGGPGITEFSVYVYDDDPTVDELKNAAVKFSVSGPNGLASYTVFGTTH